MDIFDSPLVCVDVETDGMNYTRGHVIEVAAIRIEQGQIVDTFTTLLNPGIEIPYFITNLTGIRTSDIQGAPAFDDVAERLLEIMDGAVFVAHNVRFDYSFLKQEFMRVGIDFAPKQLCTVKLSRALYPDQSSHKLAALIARHGFSYSARHRAYDDAHVLYQFLQHANTHFGSEIVAGAAHEQLQLPSLPRHLDRTVVDQLPQSHGVYIFENEAGAPLYIGKSVNIRRRVLSHFTRDSAEYKEFKMAQLVHHISYQSTGGELSALLLESQLIKTMQPVYNRRLRRRRTLLVARKTYDERGYITITFTELQTITPADYEQILAIYPTRTKAKASIITAVRTYDLCPKLCGLEKGSGSCFSYQLHKCRGACIGVEPAEQYNRRLLTAFAQRGIAPWPHSGAVLVSEAVDSPDGFIVEDWRITASAHRGRDGTLSLEPYSATFDLDAYKILHAHMSSYDTLVVSELPKLTT